MKAALISVSLISMVMLLAQGAAAEPLRYAAMTDAARSIQPKAGGQADWPTTVEAAKREGTVVVYEQWGPRARAELGRAFKNKFDIDIQFVSAGTSTQLVPKITT